VLDLCIFLGLSRAVMQRPTRALVPTARRLIPLTLAASQRLQRAARMGKAHARHDGCSPKQYVVWVSIATARRCAFTTLGPSSMYVKGERRWTGAWFSMDAGRLL
jgi:hypothetical protein